MMKKRELQPPIAAEMPPIHNLSRGPVAGLFMAAELIIERSGVPRPFWV